MMHRVNRFKGKNLIGAKILAITALIVVFSSTAYAQSTWGNNNSRTEGRDDAGLQGSQGAVSGFFETASPVNFPQGASSWWHLLDVRHSNTANNYSMQFAGSFFDQELWFRKTNNSASQSWKRVLAEATGTLGYAAGSQHEMLRVTSYTTNAAQLRFVLHRFAEGSSWESASTRIQSVTDATNQGYIDFNPQGGASGLALGSGSTELFRVQSNGNVGVGTQNPLERLQIGDRLVFQDGGWKGFLFNLAWDQNVNRRMVDGYTAGMYFTNLGNILFVNGPSGAAGSADNSVHSLVIHNSGQVGIGTDVNVAGFPDAEYKLLVAGGVRARKVKVDQSAWADYVFAPTYKLPSLKDVESFIQQYQHLPEVPPAKEVAEEGLDVGESQAVLLKKIEELTLYIIEQNKRIEKLETTVQELSTK